MAKEYKLKRPIPKKVRFSKEEWAYVDSRIKASPFKTFQNYARILLISGEVKVVDYSSLEKLNREVNRIGNNMNQVAKLAHQFEEISAVDIQNLMNEVQQLKDLVSSELEKEYQQERTI